MCGYKCHSVCCLRAAVAAAMNAAAWGVWYSIAARAPGRDASAVIVGGGLAATSTLTWVGPVAWPAARLFDRQPHRSITQPMMKMMIDCRWLVRLLSGSGNSRCHMPPSTCFSSRLREKLLSTCSIHGQPVDRRHSPAANTLGTVSRSSGNVTARRHPSSCSAVYNTS